MKRVLGRKQASRNIDWLEAMRHIEELISLDEVKAYEATAVERIAKAADGKRAAYAWSAGKDSIVLGKLCEKAGVTDSFFAHCDLEFPEYLSWALENMPVGCEVINTGLDLEWLGKHPELMFVNDAKHLVWAYPEIFVLEILQGARFGCAAGGPSHYRRKYLRKGLYHSQEVRRNAIRRDCRLAA